MDKSDALIAMNRKAAEAIYATVDIATAQDIASLFLDNAALLASQVARIAEVEQERDALREALRFYADRKHYGTRVCCDGDGHYDVMDSDAELDAGAIARAALAPAEQETNDGR